MRFLLGVLATAALIVPLAFACKEAETPAADPAPGADAGELIPTDGGTKARPDEPGRPVKVTNETMTFAGRTRQYILALPRTMDPSKSYPLVMSLHGNPGTADGEATYRPVDTATKDEAVIVYPQSVDEGWDQYTPTESNLDMSWIRALPDEVATKAKIDKSKIFGIGFSGGSFFLTNFTCRFGGVFRAISSNAGGGPGETESGFAQKENECFVCPGGPIATLVIHGAEDDGVGRTSGEFTALCNSETNGCGEALSDTAPAPCKQYDGCPPASPVKYCLIPGLGHDVWSSALTESWAFFQSL